MGTLPCPSCLEMDVEAEASGGDIQPCFLPQHCRSGHCQMSVWSWHWMVSGCWTLVSLGPKEHMEKTLCEPLCGWEGLPETTRSKDADKSRHPSACSCDTSPLKQNGQTHLLTAITQSCCDPTPVGQFCTRAGFAMEEVKGSSVVSHGQDEDMNILA